MPITISQIDNNHRIKKVWYIHVIIDFVNNLSVFRFLAYS